MGAIQFDSECDYLNDAAAVAVRYRRLADVTSGMIRNILLTLAAEAEARGRSPAGITPIIDLYPVPDPQTAPADTTTRYALRPLPSRLIPIEQVSQEGGAGPAAGLVDDVAQTWQIEQFDRHAESAHEQFGGTRPGRRPTVR